MDVNKVIDPNKYLIMGHYVQFPFKPYPSQMAMMVNVLKSIISSKHALLESPTGTGKTLALLCSALTWQNGEKQKLEESKLKRELSNSSIDTNCNVKLQSDEKKDYKLKSLGDISDKVNNNGPIGVKIQSNTSHIKNKADNSQEKNHIRSTSNSLSETNNNTTKIGKKKLSLNPNRTIKRQKSSEIVQKVVIEIDADDSTDSEKEIKSHEEMRYLFEVYIILMVCYSEEEDEAFKTSNIKIRSLESNNNQQETNINSKSTNGSDMNLNDNKFDVSIGN
jgi:Rad3-related DNA helicase